LKNGRDMKLVYGEYGIDFEAPVYMSDEQREKFIKFMQKLLPTIKVTFVREKEKLCSGGGTARPWTIDELVFLLKTDDNEALARKIGRTEMSIRMERAQLQPEFFRWAEKMATSSPQVIQSGSL
jgi:transcriptional regulator GlxA family with amidase domain